MNTLYYNFIGVGSAAVRCLTGQTQHSEKGETSPLTQEHLQQLARARRVPVTHVFAG